MFCPKCKSVLKPMAVVCDNCGTPVKTDMKFSEQIKRKKEIKSAEGDIETLPTIKIECSKCGNGTAYIWTRQIAYADEPETEFYKCTKCGHRWRSQYIM